ncbi:MAG: hypothetical protein KME26_06135 [Oscillatoria princeps RMCB-10]|nr:hypothetical protein [Oscillatoria princeps RMCB-10]
MEEGHNSGGSHPAQAGQKVPLERIAGPEYQPERYFARKHGILQPAEEKEGTVLPVALHLGCELGSVAQLRCRRRHLASSLRDRGCGPDIAPSPQGR